MSGLGEFGALADLSAVRNALGKIKTWSRNLNAGTLAFKESTLLPYKNVQDAIDGLIGVMGFQWGKAEIISGQAADLFTIPAGQNGLLIVGHSTAASVSIFGVDTIGTYEISTKVLGTAAANGGLGSATAGSGLAGEHTWYVSSGGVISVSNRTAPTNTFWAKFSRGNL